MAISPTINSRLPGRTNVLTNGFLNCRRRFESSRGRRKVAVNRSIRLDQAVPC